MLCSDIYTQWIADTDGPNFNKLVEMIDSVGLSRVITMFDDSQDYSAEDLLGIIRAYANQKDLMQ